MLTLTSALREMFGVQLYKNNARALLLRILSILNLDWLQHVCSVRGVYEMSIFDICFASVNFLLSMFCNSVTMRHVFKTSEMYQIYIFQKIVSKAREQSITFQADRTLYCDCLHQSTFHKLVCLKLCMLVNKKLSFGKK